jgi:transketolase
MYLPVNIVSVGAGFTYSTDGPTHQGIQDLPAVMTVPNLSVFNSSDPFSTRAFAEIAVTEPGAKYIRIEKGNLNTFFEDMSHNYSEGVACIRDGTDIVIVSSGAILHEAMKAAELLQNETGLKVGVIDLYRPKPLPIKSLISLLSVAERIVTL